VNAIRPFGPGDVDDVIRLHTAVFTNQGKPGAGAPDVREYYAEFLLENPWRDDELAPLVFESGGRVISFLGVIPRRFMFEGRPIRTAVATNFMAEPGSVKAAVGAAAMVKQFLAGPQDLSLCDGTIEVRRMWEPLGAIATPIFGIRWTRALRPALLAIRLLRRPEERAAWRPGRVARQIGGVVDAAVNRSSRLPFRLLPADGETRSIDAAHLAGIITSETHGFSLAPDYDAADLRWLGSYIARHSDRGPLELCAVFHEDREVGWFVHQANPGGSATVLQIGATDGMLGLVARHMLWRTAHAGALTVEGRLDPDLLHAFGGQVYCRQPGWKLAAARDPRILSAISRGDAFLSPLDGDPLA
jgi:hypothetical protein